MSIYPKEIKPVSQRAICTSMCIAVLFTIAKIQKQPKSLPRDEWIITTIQREGKWEGGSRGRGSSAGKEYACNAGYPSLIPGLGSSPGEGIGYPLQYSWASLAAQMVKKPPEMWETWVRSLGLEDPLQEGMATHSSILAWSIPMDRGAWWATVHGVAKSWTLLSN